VNTSRIRWMAPLLSVSLLAGALWLLHRELATHHPRDILQAMRAMPLSAILAAFGLTVASDAFLPV